MSEPGAACVAPAVVDVHAHIFPTGLPDLARTTGDPRWPSLAVADDETGRIMCGDRIFRKVRAPLWDLAARLDELNRAGVGAQVVSPVPVMLTYWAASDAATDFARAVNDGIAAQVASSDGRLIGLGTVALQDVDAAVVELTRLTTQLGLRGVEIGTHAAGLELDDPRLQPFFEAARALDAAVFVHPMDGGGGTVRREGQPYDFGLGMLTDTAIAATGLVFGGVLEKLPGLRIGLAHGCGTFAWAYPRLRLAARLGGDVDAGRFDELVRALWVDCLVFDPLHLRLLTERFGDDHVMVGTDHPFVPGQLEGVSELLRGAVADRGLTREQADRIRGANALAFVKALTPADGTPSGLRELVRSTGDATGLED